MASPPLTSLAVWVLLAAGGGGGSASGELIRSPAFFFCLWAGALSGLVAAGAHLDEERFILTWPAVRQGRVFRFKSQLGALVARAFKLTLVSLLVAVVTYVRPLPDYLIPLMWGGRSAESAAQATLAVFGWELHLSALLVLVRLLPLLHFALLVHSTMLHIVHSEVKELGGIGGGEGSSVSPPALDWSLAVHHDSPLRYAAYVDLSTQLAAPGPLQPRLRAVFADSGGAAWAAVATPPLLLLQELTTRLGDLEEGKRAPMTAGGRAQALRAEYAARNAFFDWQLHVHAARSLSLLLVRAFDEDKYGLAQHDLPLFVNTLLESLLAVERAIGRGLVAAVQRSDRRGRVKAVQLELKHAVYRVVTTYYEHLASFKFSLDVTARLQSFLDFHES